MQRKSDDASHANVLARLFDPPAVDSGVALLDDRLGERAALHQPDAVEIAVDPHVFLSFASSAKAWQPGRGGPAAGRDVRASATRLPHG